MLAGEKNSLAIAFASCATRSDATVLGRNFRRISKLRASDGGASRDEANKSAADGSEGGSSVRGAWEAPGAAYAVSRSDAMLAFSSGCRSESGE
jgi:hypothetical protein